MLPCNITDLIIYVFIAIFALLFLPIYIFIMNEPKGVIRYEKYITISAAQAAEIQRNWGHERQFTSLDHRYYDLSRRHLNFEITRGGMVVPRLSSGLITERLQNRWNELHYHPKRKRSTQQPYQNGVVSLVISGDNTVMCNLAFGNQVVDFTRSPKVDNSHVIRLPAIEQWAIDCYRMVSDLYGEDNIVGCDVHLDEQTPHIHIEFVPTMINAQHEIVVSVHHHFGQPWQISALHDNYFNYVGHKYNLARGDTPTQDVVAPHLSTRDYIRDKQRLEREIASLQNEKEKLLEQNIIRTPKFKF